MAIAEQTLAFDWEHASWQEAKAHVSAFTDRLGTPIDAGIVETVVVLNLLGLQTFQSCEGHLTEGRAYPWVTLVHHPLSGRFVRRWQVVCQLEEQARALGTVEAYDSYLAEDVRLQMDMIKWEEEDVLSRRLKELLEDFYGQEESLQYKPERLVVVKYHPGMVRLEPFFGSHMKSSSEALQSIYLARGQAEMQAFTRYLKRCWQGGREA
jgi:hypothetical protein